MRPTKKTLLWIYNCLLVAQLGFYVSFLSAGLESLETPLKERKPQTEIPLNRLDIYIALASKQVAEQVKLKKTAKQHRKFLTRAVLQRNCS